LSPRARFFKQGPAKNPRSPRWGPRARGLLQHKRNPRGRAHGFPKSKHKPTRTASSRVPVIEAGSLRVRFTEIWLCPYSQSWLTKQPGSPIRGDAIDVAQMRVMGANCWVGRKDVLAFVRTRKLFSHQSPLDIPMAIDTDRTPPCRCLGQTHLPADARVTIAALKERFSVPKECWSLLTARLAYKTRSLEPA